MSQTQILDLQRLNQGLPAITPAFGAAIAEAGAICLTDEAHEPGVILEVEGEFSTQFQLDWQPVTEQARRCWNDEEYTTEQAAYAISCKNSGAGIGDERRHVQRIGRIRSP